MTRRPFDSTKFLFTKEKNHNQNPFMETPSVLTIASCLEQDMGITAMNFPIFLDNNKQNRNYIK